MISNGEFEKNLENIDEGNSDQLLPTVWSLLRTFRKELLESKVPMNISAVQEDLKRAFHGMREEDKLWYYWRMCVVKLRDSHKHIIFLLWNLTFHCWFRDRCMDALQWIASGNKGNMMIRGRPCIMVDANFHIYIYESLRFYISLSSHYLIWELHNEMPFVCIARQCAR